MKRKKPDLMVVLALIIGMGLLATELTYGGVFADNGETHIAIQH